MTNSELKLGVLTKRQQQVWRLSRKHLHHDDIALELGIAYNTVRRHLAGARAKMRNKRIVQKVNHRHD